jgi:hypothetical protein
MLLCTYASADLINFDDISTGSAGYANVPSNYLGLTWSGDWEVISQAYYNAHYPGAVTFPSSPNAAYNGLDFGGNVLSTSSGTAFTLDSLYASRFVGAGPQSSTLTLTAYLGGSLVGSDTLNLSNGFVQWAPALGGLVDKVEFTGDSLANYVYLIDDVTITPVPVPAAVLLGMLGFCVAGLKLRKLA